VFVNKARGSQHRPLSQGERDRVRGLCLGALAAKLKHFQYLL
jgi:hypothetical protein